MSREPTVEVAHEALIREWPRLRRWLDHDREGLRIHRHLTTTATAWADRGRDDSDLYRGVRLGAAEAWVDAARPALNPLEVEFLGASITRRDADELDERNRVRRLRRLLVTTGVVALIALVAGAIAVRQQRRADDQAALARRNAVEADASAELADQRADEAELATDRADLERLRAVALSMSEESPAVAALLAVEAHAADPSVESLDVLHRVLTAVPGFHGTVAGGPYLDAYLFDDGVTLAAVSPDTVDVWDLRTLEILRSIDHANPVPTGVIASTSDGRVAAIRGELDETELYDLTTGASLGSLRHDAQVNDLSLSPEGSRLAVALAGGTVEIWDVASLDLDATLDTGDADAFFARWSPTEDRIAVVTLLSEAQWWDGTSGELLWADAAPPGAVVNESTPFGFLFGSDGRSFVFVSGSLGGELRVYDTGDGSHASHPLAGLPSRGFLLDSLFWVDEQARVVGIPSGGNVATFDLGSGQPGAELLPRFVRRASDAVYSSVLGRFVVAGPAGLELWSTDGSGPLARVAPLTSGQRQSLASGTVLTSLAADGSRLMVSVFSVSSRSATTAFDLSADPLTPTIFDAEGAVTIGYGPYTLVGGVAGARILDESDEPLGPPVPLPFDFSELAVSPDGRYLGIGRLGGLTDLYTGSGDFVATLAISDGAEYEGAQTAPWFTSDGDLVTVTTTEGSFGLWSTDTLERIDVPDESWTFGTLMGEWLFVKRPDGSFQRVDPSTFEPVGEPVVSNPGGFGYSVVDETNLRVALPSVSGLSVSIIDLETGLPLGRELPYVGGASRVEFTADGTILSAPRADGVTLWNYDTDTWAAVACEMAGRNLTADEWAQLGPRTIERRATCPQYPL